MTVTWLVLAIAGSVVRAADPGAAIIRHAALVQAGRSDTVRPMTSAGGWNGSFGGFVLLGLYGTYRSVFAASDMPSCNFTPSCSHFSERAVATCGLGRGILLSADRLLRDHPFAVPWYPPDHVTGLLIDPAERYCDP